MKRNLRTLSRSIELAVAAPAVIALRTARLLPNAGASRAANHAEATRMVTEKLQAFGEAWLAIAFAQQHACLGWWLAFGRAAMRASLAPRRSHAPTARALARRVHRANLAALAHGLAPIHRTATANLRRLSRRAR